MSSFSIATLLLAVFFADCANGFALQSKLGCTSSVSRYSSANDNNNNYDLVVTTEVGSLRGKVSPFFRSALALLVAVPTIANTVTINSRVNAAAPSEEKYLDALATLITCKKVLESVDNYIEVQAYDNARTNVNYLLNQLFLEKKVQSLIQQSLDFSEDSDAVDVGQEAGSRVSNTAIQLDSTLYTCVFIPPSDDGGVPPAAEKYRKQCFDFLKVGSYHGALWQVQILSVSSLFLSVLLPNLHEILMIFTPWNYLGAKDGYQLVVEDRIPSSVGESSGGHGHIFETTTLCLACTFTLLHPIAVSILD